MADTENTCAMTTFIYLFFHQGREQSWQEQDFLPQEAEIYTL